MASEVSYRVDQCGIRTPHCLEPIYNINENDSVAFDISPFILMSTVRSWLYLFDNAGVDLVEFGRVENALHHDNQVKWAFTENMEATGKSSNYCRFKILDIRIRATLDEFHIEFVDLCLCTACNTVLGVSRTPSFSRQRGDWGDTLCLV